METTNPDDSAVNLGPLEGFPEGLTLWRLTTSDPERLARLDDADDATSVAAEFAERACNDWTSILRTKHDFFWDIYSDGRWKDVFEFADLSRRYSQFIKRIWYVITVLRGPDATPKPPSQTEVNAWFHHFHGSDQLRESNVPEHLIPTTRGVSAALASATAPISDAKERLDAQVAILQRCDAELQRNLQNGLSGFSMTAKTVKQIASEMGYRKTKPPLPLDLRELSDLDTETWNSICRLFMDLRGLSLAQLDAEAEHKRFLELTRKVERLIVAPERSVFVELDDRNCFVGWVVENFVTAARPSEQGVKHAKQFDGYLGHKPGSGGVLGRLGLDRHSLSNGDLKPRPDRDVCPPGTNWDHLFEYQCGQPESGIVLSRVAMANDARQSQDLLAEAVTALGSRCAAVPLSQWHWWDERGGCPVGTYVDEVIEPTVDPVAAVDADTDEASGDGSPVL